MFTAGKHPFTAGLAFHQLKVYPNVLGAQGFSVGELAWVSDLGRNPRQ